MQRAIVKKTFIEALEKERVLRGWSQQEMAAKLEMSVPGYRKMVAGMTETISLYTALRASDVFDIPIRCLCGMERVEDRIQKKLMRSPESVKTKVEYLLNYEEKYREFQNKHKEEHIINLYELTGYMEDGMYLDSANVRKIKISDDYGGRVTKGLLVTENSFMPVYAKDEIILIEEKVGRNGDTVVIKNLKTRKIYIRKVIVNNGFELHPIHGRGEVIRLGQEQRSEWFDYGRVVAHIPLMKEDYVELDVELDA